MASDRPTRTDIPKQILEQATRLFAARGFVDNVIEAHTTRPYLIRALEVLRSKHEPGPTRKHGNIPL